ncbi:Rieske (2Fe-2S) protein [Pseudonocardia xishanensis]|uniref:Rieske (2Fe-2S) protein n=1 Tax=Pseudonocardia xishanensis TaxID=630995 RepID=A0ABP8RV51_9PSEU
MCKSVDLSRGEMRGVVLGRTPIVVLRTPVGDVGAVADRCPHRGAKLSGGVLEETVASDGIGEVRMSGEFHVRCPWHRFQFDASDGICGVDRRQRVRVFPATEEDGMVVVEAG